MVSPCMHLTSIPAVLSAMRGGPFMRCLLSMPLARLSGVTGLIGISGRHRLRPLGLTFFEVAGQRGISSRGCHSFAGRMHHNRLLMFLKRMLSLAACVLILLDAGGRAFAQSLLIEINQPMPNERMRDLKRYLDSRNMGLDTKVFFAEFEGIRIFRISSKSSCMGEKCLTIAVLDCDEDTCNHVKILAPPSVYSNPLYIDLLGGLRSIAFGRPGGPGTALMFGRGVLIVSGH